MKSAPDPTLIKAASTGDTEALEPLLLQYQPTITRFARKYCATPEDVEDAVQETLWIAAQKIGTLRVTSAFISWLFQVVRHQCFRLLKMVHNETALPTSLTLEQADGNPELHIALQNDVVNAIARLSTE